MVDLVAMAKSVKVVRSGLFRSAGMSAIVRLGTFPITAAATLLTTAMVISYAGAKGFAAITVIATLSQLIPYTDLGIGAGVVNAVSGTKQGDIARMSAIATALRILFVSASLIFLAGIAGITVFSWGTVLHVSGAGFEQIDITTFLVAVLFATAVPMGIGQRILLGLSLNPWAVGLGALAPVVSLGASAAVIVLGLPAVLLALAVPLGTLVSAFLGALVGLKKVDFRIAYLFDRRTYRYRGLVHQGLWYLLVTITSAATLQYGRVILAGVSHLGNVAEFSLAMQFYSPLWSFFVVAGTSLWPAFSRNRARAAANQGRALVLAIFVFAGAGLVAFAGLVTLGPWLAGILSKSHVLPGLGVFAACGLLVIVQAVQLVLGVYLTSTADFRFQAIFGLPMAATAIVGCWALAPALGAAAPFIAGAAALFTFIVIPSTIRVLVGAKSRSGSQGLA